MNIEQLSLTFAGSSLLRGVFKRDLKVKTPDSFISKPSMLSRLEKERRDRIRSLKDSINTQRAEILRRSDIIKALSNDTDSQTTVNLAARSIWIELKLAEFGALYGDKPFNFILSDFKLPRQTLLDIQQTALTAYSTILSCKPIEPTQISDSERFIDKLNLTPNGARVDIILTPEGPKVIEVNLQWIDAIQALESFQIAYLGMPQKTLELLAGVFKGSGRLAILDITSATGSRSAGARLELQVLRSNLERRFNFQEVELLDPRKVLNDFLKEFDGFYINGEPSMIPSSIPDWLKVIMEYSRKGRVFPLWRPALDRKRVLIEASNKSTAFVSTIPFSEENLLRVKQDWEYVVIKGSGYSSNCVGMEGTQGFKYIISDAKLSPDDYTIQPRLEPVELDPMFCFDTSAKRPVFISQPKTKFNVWIINGRIGGVLVSLSDKLIISDKDFNAVPKPI